ncbi:uncharacterized protein HKW66_Vig0073690 [Vigna angularis]|uniref:Uncharacterized protein n=1 Tax=Phaseolus angularis TaxID=3914 RepID=A0A8T0KAJ6_PHAAN|nr:uncharacterized protein HKW66_Vig0073690 [Vigna angularis]
MVVHVKDLRDKGYGFAFGDFGRGQVESKPWWLGLIYDPPDDALKMEQKNRSSVTFFHHFNAFWDNIDERVKQSSCIDFANVVEAAGEVGRPPSMKLRHKLLDFMDTQLVPGIENSLLDETVAV